MLLLITATIIHKEYSNDSQGKLQLQILFFIKEKGRYTTLNLGFVDHAFSQDKEALILSTVQAIRLLTVATDPRESFAVGTESTKI